MSKSLTTTIQIDGANELAVIMAELPKRSVETACKQAANAGGQVVAKATRQAAPVESGLTKKAIDKKTKFFKKNSTAISIIGARNDIVQTYNDKNRRPSKYWHLIIRGTSKKQANPFDAMALALSADAAADKSTEKMQQAVQRQAERLARK